MLMALSRTYRMIDNQCLVPESSLLKLGANYKDLKSNSTLFNAGKITRYANLKDPETSERLFLLEFLPLDLLERLELPKTREEFLEEYEKQEAVAKANASDKNLSYIWLILREAFT